MNMPERNPILWKDRKHFLWFPWSFTRYSLDCDRLYTDVGLLTTRHDEALLYRIVDLSLTRTLGQRICGTGTVTLHTRVDVSGQIILKNIKKPEEVNRLLSDLIEKARSRRQVVGKEFYSHDHDLDGDGEIDNFN